jgi:hypothetical protein
MGMPRQSGYHGTDEHYGLYEPGNGLFQSRKMSGAQQKYGVALHFKFVRGNNQPWKQMFSGNKDSSGSLVLCRQARLYAGLPVCRDKLGNGPEGQAIEPASLHKGDVLSPYCAQRGFNIRTRGLPQGKYPECEIRVHGSLSGKIC